MNLRHLYFFRVLAENQHYGKTAEQLFTTQSNISYAIASLEKELGVSLFEKQGRNVILTSNGKIFLRRVNNAIVELESGVKELRENCNRLAQEIRIATVRTLLTNDLIHDFFGQAQYGNMHLCINQCKTDRALLDLTNGFVDLCFCSYTVDNPSLIFIPAVRQKLVALVPHNYSVGNADYLSLHELAQYPLIIPTGLDEIHWQVMQYFADNGITPIQQCKATSTTAAAMLAANGEGIAVVVDSPLLDFFQLRALPIVSPASSLYLYLTYVKDRWHSQAMNDFIQYVKRNAPF